MTKPIHKGKRKTIETVARKARAGRFASEMKPEYLAEIDGVRKNRTGDLKFATL